MLQCLFFDHHGSLLFLYVFIVGCRAALPTFFQKYRWRTCRRSSSLWMWDEQRLDLGQSCAMICSRYLCSPWATNPNDTLLETKVSSCPFSVASCRGCLCVAFLQVVASICLLWMPVRSSLLWSSMFVCHVCLLVFFRQDTNDTNADVQWSSTLPPWPDHCWGMLWRSTKVLAGARAPCFLFGHVWTWMAPAFAHALLLALQNKTRLYSFTVYFGMNTNTMNLLPITSN